MFEFFILVFTLLGVQFTAYEDCTIVVSDGPAPIVRAVEDWNDLPDSYRDCSDSAWRWDDGVGPRN